MRRRGFGFVAVRTGGAGSVESGTGAARAVRVEEREGAAQAQDAFDDVISARLVKPSGNEHIDAAVVDLASLLPPRFRDKAQQVYTPRYDMAVRYTCVRDAYGVTGRAAVSL